jgi:fructose-1,6-bisphosphatase I
VTAAALAGPGEAVEAAARLAFAQALRDAPVAAIAWRGGERPERWAAGAALVLALCPLEGADDLDGGMPAGTLFSLRPAGPDPEAAFLAPGRTQVAAGFVTYGPRTLLTVTDGATTTVRVLDPRSSTFRPGSVVRIPEASPRCAGGGARARHGEAPVRAFVEDHRRGADEPRGQDVSQAWCASLAAGAQRVLSRGGLHPCPAETEREGASVRLVHEAAPVALAIEAAGGAATDGRGRAILDLAAATLDQRTPLAFGSAHEVARLARDHDEDRGAGRSPLFAVRGLLRT